MRGVMRTRSDQRGAALMEVIVAILLIGIVGAAVVTTTLTSLRAGVVARTEAQLNALSTTYGEALKAVSYRPCETDGDQYELAVSTADLSNDIDQRLTKLDPNIFRPTEDGDVKVQVDEVVDSDGDALSCPDPGNQLIRYHVTINGRSKSASIMKRSPVSPVPDPTIEIEAVQQYPTNWSRVKFALRLKATSRFPAGVDHLEWWCDGSWVGAEPAVETPVAPGTAPDLVYDTTDPWNQAILCGDYAAPVIGSPFDAATHQRIVALRLTDGAGKQHLLTEVVPFPQTTVGVDPPWAAVHQLTPCTVDGDKCEFRSVIEFDGQGSGAPPGQRIEECVWNFGDGSLEVVLHGPNCFEEVVSHEFLKSSTVTLTVKDEFGKTGVSSKNVVIKGPQIERPQVRLIGSVNTGSDVLTYEDQTLESLAPERVAFKSIATPSNAGGQITGFHLDYGDTSGLTPQGPGVATGGSRTFEPPDEVSGRQGHEYNSPSTAANCSGEVGFLAKVTVTELVPADVAAGRPTDEEATMDAVLCVKLSPLPSLNVGVTRPFARTALNPGELGTPNNFYNVRNVWCGLLGCDPRGTIDFRFEWTRIGVPVTIRDQDLRIHVSFDEYDSGGISSIWDCRSDIDNYKADGVNPGIYWTDVQVAALGQSKKRNINIYTGIQPDSDGCQIVVTLERQFEGTWLASPTRTVQAKGRD